MKHLRKYNESFVNSNTDIKYYKELYDTVEDIFLPLTDNGFDISIITTFMDEKIITIKYDIKEENSVTIRDIEIDEFLNKNKILYNELPSILKRLSEIVKIDLIRSENPKNSIYIRIGVTIKNPYRPF